MHGISKALVFFNPDYYPVLRKAGFMTCDSRIVERKKPGLKKATKVDDGKNLTDCAIAQKIGCRICMFGKNKF